MNSREFLKSSYLPKPLHCPFRGWLTVKRSISCCPAGRLLRLGRTLSPIPWKQIMKAVESAIRQPVENIGELRAQIDAVELAALDQRKDGATATGARKRACGRIIGVRTRICPSADASKSNSASSPPDRHSALNIHAAVYNLFNIDRHLTSRRTMKEFRGQAMRQSGTSAADQAERDLCKSAPSGEAANIRRNNDLTGRSARSPRGD